MISWKIVALKVLRQLNGPVQCVINSMTAVTNWRSIMFLVTLRATCGAVYCNRSCLCVCVFVGGSVTTITRNYVHRYSPSWVCR